MVEGCCAGPVRAWCTCAWRCAMLLPCGLLPCSSALCPTPCPMPCSFSNRPPPKGGQQRSRCFAEMLLCAGSWEQEALNISQASCGDRGGFWWPGGIPIACSCCPGPAKGAVQNIADVYGLCPARSNPQAAQTLVRLNEPLPPSPVTYPTCRSTAGKGSNSTCLRVLFLTRSPKPAVRQVSCAGHGSGQVTVAGRRHVRVREQCWLLQKVDPCLNPCPPCR